MPAGGRRRDAQEWRRGAGQPREHEQLGHLAAAALTFRDQLWDERELSLNKEMWRHVNKTHLLLEHTSFITAELLYLIFSTRFLFYFVLTRKSNSNSGFFLTFKAVQQSPQLKEQVRTSCLQHWCTEKTCSSPGERPCCWMPQRQWGSDLREQ